MSGPDDANAELRRFAADLRALRDRAGIGSARELARRVHFSHTTTADALGGEKLPTIHVVRAIVVECGGEIEEWERRWNRLDVLLQTQVDVASTAPPPSAAASPWPAVPIVDGADPDQAGCSSDATTVHARRIALKGERRIIGAVELRYSPRRHAAWGRFKGYPLLDRLAVSGTDVVVLIDVVREQDGQRGPFEQQYSFDLHWGDLVLTGKGRFYACATVQFSGELAAYGETDRIELA